MASIPIKEQLLYNYDNFVYCDTDCFNSYKGTIVIRWGRIGYREYLELQFL